MSTGTNKKLMGLEYIQRLHSDVMDWYNRADTKAQVILTLDAAFLTFVATGILQSKDAVIQLPEITLILLFGVAISLIVSIYSAIACIWSRIHSKEHLSKVLKESGVVLSDSTTYSPHTSWFFQYVSALEINEFEQRVQSIDITFEIKALTYQTYILSENVSKKHHYVNRGFIFSAISLLFLLLSAISFVISVQATL